MVQVIDTGGDFGSRLGRAYGKSLSDSLPKEVARRRLSQGLKDVGEVENASPFQQFAALAGVPGITPQMLESGAELLKQQRFRQAYKGQGQERVTREEAPSGESIRDVQFGKLPGQIERRPQGKAQEGEQPQVSFGSVKEQALANPPAASDNPLDEKYLPAKPWNQDMQDKAISEAFDTGKATTLQEANAYANQQRQWYDSAPESERARYNYKRGVDATTEQLFDDQLKKRLGKTEKETTFDQIPGDLQLGLVKQAKTQVATGKMTPQEAAEYYSTAALNLRKTWNNAIKLANADLSDTINPKKQEERVKNLETMGKAFGEFGASEFFYDFLKTKGTDAKGNYVGMGLSPGKAATIAYPVSKKLEGIISKADFPLFNYEKRQQAANKVAEEVLNAIGPNDSFLAVARKLKDSKANFDEVAFFDYIREHPEFYQNNKRLAREVEEGVSDVLPNWGDIFLFPHGAKGSKTFRGRI